MFLFFVYQESRWPKFIYQIVNCLSAGNSFITNFSPTLSSRSLFHIGVIHKYKYTAPSRNTHCSRMVTENKRLMEMITAVHCWQIINSHTWTALHAVKHNAVKRSTKLITFLHSERYRPSGISIHRQNSYAPCSRRCTGRREPINKVRTSLFMPKSQWTGPDPMRILLRTARSTKMTIHWGRGRRAELQLTQHKIKSGRPPRRYP
jgi:hypothetical protein